MKCFLSPKKLVTCDQPKPGYFRSGAWCGDKALGTRLPKPSMRLGAIIFGHVSTVLDPFANVCFLRWLVHYVIDEVS